MPFKSDISRDLGEAMKAHDELRVGVLRLLSAAIHGREIERRMKQGSEEISDAEVLDILRSEVKKRREAAQIFDTAKRQDLADKELSEVKVIQKYLPPEMGAAEVRQAVAAILGKGKFKNFGEAMKAVMAELKGKADAKLIGDEVRKTIGGDGF